MAFSVSSLLRRPNTSQADSRPPGQQNAHPGSQEAGRSRLPSASYSSRQGAQESVAPRSAWDNTGGHLPLPTKVQPILRNLRNLYEAQDGSPTKSGQAVSSKSQVASSPQGTGLSFSTYMQQARNGQAMIAVKENKATEERGLSNGRSVTILTRDLTYRKDGPSSPKWELSPKKGLGMIMRDQGPAHLSVGVNEEADQISIDVSPFRRGMMSPKTPGCSTPDSVSSPLRRKQPVNTFGMGSKSASCPSSPVAMKGSDESPAPARPGTSPQKKVTFSPNRQPTGSTRKQAQVAQELHLMDKRSNAAQALAHDRAMVTKLMARETLGQRAFRNMRVEGRRLEMLFAPIQKPQDHIPDIFRTCEATSRAEAVYSDQQLHDMRTMELTTKELLRVEHLCDTFSSLSRPFVPPGEVEASPMLTRSALCRMLIDSDITDCNGNIVYHIALEIFDSLASQHTIKGSPLTSGTSYGLTHDERLGQFFVGLLSWLVKNFKDSLTAEDVKSCFFHGQLAGAMKKSKRRLRYVSKQLEKGKAIFFEHLKFRSEGRGSERSGSPKSGHAGKHGAGDDNSPGAPSDDEEDADDWEAKDTRDRKPSLDNDENKDETQEFKDDASSVSSTAREESGPRMSEEDALYAHTSMISKGEFLTCMLLEPEVLHLTWMFWPNFACIFEAYVDEETQFLGRSSSAGGHMSIASFTRCCGDLGIFPSLVEFNSLQCMYWSVESGIDMPRDHVKRCHRKNPEDAEFLLSDIVVLAPMSKRDCVHGVHEIKYGDPLKVVDVDISDVDAQACRVMTARGKQHWILFNDLMKTERPFQLRERGSSITKDGSNTKISWINKEFDDMNDVEVRSMSILSVFSDYICARHMRARDLFSRFDNSGDGEIDTPEMCKGIHYLGIDEPPSEEEVEQMMRLIDFNGSGALDFLEVDSVVQTVQERKARHRNRNNPFVKEHHRMTQGEQAADKFFVPLCKEIDARGWSAEDFIEQFDIDGNEQLSLRELIKVGRTLGINTENAHFEKGVMLVDPNFDGALCAKEITAILKMVREANRVKEQALMDAENPFLRDRHVVDHSTVRIFGKKAFVESLLKIGLGYMCFHGTPEQSELPTQSKVVWFLSYLNWHFSLHKAERKVQESEKWKKCSTKLGSRRSLRSEVAAMVKRGFKPVAFREDQVDDAQQAAGDLQASDEQGESAQPLLQYCATASEPLILEEAASSPLKHLLKTNKKLFESPGTPPKIGEISFAREGPCPSCKEMPQAGWGRPSCSKCGLGDEILKACLVSDVPEAIAMPVLHPLITLLGTKGVSPSSSLGQSYMSGWDTTPSASRG